MKNFCSKVLLDLKNECIEGFIQLFKHIWDRIY